MATERETSTEELRRWQDTHADYVSGTKDQLIAAGICQAGWFPKKLQPEFKKDGSPYMGNNGRQRMRRTYSVEGRQPETILTVRRDAYGTELWTAQIAVSDKERQRREELDRQKREEQQRRYEERLREIGASNERAREAAQPAVRQLRSRYPGMVHIEGEINTNDDGTRRQGFTFYARSLDLLVKYGLVTDEMLNSKDAGGGWRSGDLRSGGSFSLHKSSDGGGEYWYLKLWTDDQPRERKHFPVTDARRLLNEIAERRAP